MAGQGYADYEIASVLSYRFFGVFCLAFPLGLFIKGRRLKPFFLAAAIGIPIFSHLLLFLIPLHWSLAVNLSAGLWGLSYMCIQITILPFILLNTPPEQHSEAFSLSFLSFSGTIFLTGALHYLLHHWQPAVFDEAMTLRVVATLSLLSLLFAWRIQIVEKRSEAIPFRQISEKYDWGLILRAIIPTIIIAIGAGFTIPVINLFFLNVHDIPSETFSIMGSVTYGLVAMVMIFMPYIKRSFGYQTAITLFQSGAVFALFMLAMTEFYKDWALAPGIAILFYIIRQPLMNAAGPMTSELTMYYVGRKNQEIMSALNASIWSGSWFISMKIFGWLRQLEVAYAYIFLITVGLYILGVLWYWTLIREYEGRKPIPAYLRNG